MDVFVSEIHKNEDLWGVQNRKEDKCENDATFRLICLHPSTLVFKYYEVKANFIYHDMKEYICS
jgi:hypothetical protein